MGLLKDQFEGKEPDQEQDPEKMEEDYQKLFMKIGRDFVHRDDFERAMDALVEALTITLPPLGIVLKSSPIPFRSISGARDRAVVYKNALEEGDTGHFAQFDLEQVEEED